MFSTRVTDSAKFLRMPISSQALYFHLGLHADDDGIVEAFSVLRTTGCTEDDLRVLVAKQFVTVLNDDLVSFINDWNENNLIRPDRKTDSIYKDLLLSINPTVKLIEKRPRSDVKNGRDMDSPRTDNGRHKISKDKLSKDKLIEYSHVDSAGVQMYDKRTPEIEIEKETQSSNERVQAFETFWMNYPKKQGKKTAERAFHKIDLSLLPKILDAIDVQKRTEQWTKENGRYIPLPATWLNQERWNDEVRVKETTLNDVVTINDLEKGGWL